MHRPPMLPSYKFDHVCALELPVPELQGCLATEMAQLSDDIRVVAEASESALLVSNLQKASFLDILHSMISRATFIRQI